MKLFKEDTEASLKERGWTELLHPGEHLKNISITTRKRLRKRGIYYQQLNPDLSLQRAPFPSVPHPDIFWDTFTYRVLLKSVPPNVHLDKCEVYIYVQRMNIPACSHTFKFWKTGNVIMKDVYSLPVFPLHPNGVVPLGGGANAGNGMPGWIKSLS